MKSFLVVIVVLSFAALLPAEPAATLNSAGRVNDFANVFDAASRAKLDEACQEIDEKAHAQIYIVTVGSTDGVDIYDYSVSLFRKWGIGTGPANRGVLILLAVRDHRYRITVGKGLDPILKEGNVAAFGLEAVPFLRRGNYSSAAFLMTKRVGEVIAENAGVTLSSVTSQAVTSSSTLMPPVYQAQPMPRDSDTSGRNENMIFLVVCVVGVFVAYTLVRIGKMRQSYRVYDPPSPAVTTPQYIPPTDPAIFVNSAAAASIWSAADANNSGSTDFGSANSDSGSSSCDTSSSTGGGDTSGGGAGGSW